MMPTFSRFWWVAIATLALSTNVPSARAQSGGVTHTSVVVPGAARNVGALKLIVCDATTGKALAPTLKARWQMSGRATLYGSGTMVGSLPSGATFQLEVRPVEGYVTRPAVPVTIRGGALTTVNVCLKRA